MTKSELDKINHLIRTGESLLLKNQFDLPVRCILNETRKKFILLSLKEVKERKDFYQSNFLGYFPNEFRSLDCIAIFHISGFNSKNNIVNDIIGQYFPEKQVIILSSNNFIMEKAIGGVSLCKTDWNSNSSILYLTHP